MRNSSANKMILIVDDDPDIRQALTDLLESQGYTVHSVGTGWAALARVKMVKFAAVLLDLQLPDQDGREVLLLLKERDQSLPVIILTASDGQDDRMVLLRREAFALLQKPYAREKLLAVLSRATSMP
jgi:DNA-binding response OmpR family regulator